MNTKIKIYVTAATLLISGALLFNSCKKNVTAEQEQEKSDLSQVYKEKLKNSPSTTVNVVNLKGTGFYGDANGNKITVRNSSGQNNLSSCPDPGNSEFVQELVSITSEFTCNVGYRFLVEYKITSEFVPQLTNGGSLFSRGRIRLVNGSGTQVYVTPTSTVNSVISIQDNGIVGQNSNGDDMNEYVITYRSEVISESTYNLSNAVQSNLVCYTDCPNYATLNIGFSPQQQVAGSQHNTLPCTRIDKVYWNPRSGSTPANLAGCNPVGGSCFPYGYVYPAKQEVKFKKNASDNFTGVFNIYKNGLGQPSVPQNFVRYFDVYYIDVANSQGLVPGNVQVRYRNWHDVNSNGGPCVSSAWVTETWYLN